MKKEDFILVTALNGVKVLGLRPDYFKGEIIVEEPVFTKEERESQEPPKAPIKIEIVEIPGPTEEELAEIAKQKLIREKQAELAKLLGD